MSKKQGMVKEGRGNLWNADKSGLGMRAKDGTENEKKWKEPTLRENSTKRRAKSSL